MEQYSAMPRREMPEQVSPYTTYPMYCREMPETVGAMYCNTNVGPAMAQMQQTMMHMNRMCMEMHHMMEEMTHHRDRKHHCKHHC